MLFSVKPVYGARYPPLTKEGFDSKFREYENRFVFRVTPLFPFFFLYFILFLGKNEISVCQTHGDWVELAWIER